MQMRNEALVKAMEALAEAARNAGMAARVISLPESEPVKAEQPEQFEYTDDDGDSLVVVPYGDRDGWLVTDSTKGSVVHLSPDAVNRLAQYLDQHRTDTPCPGKLGHLKYEQQCAGMRGHDGPCSPDADMIGAPVAVREHRCGCTSDANEAPVTYPLPTGFDRCTGTYEGFRCRRLADHEGEHA